MKPKVIALILSVLFIACNHTAKAPNDYLKQRNFGFNNFDAAQQSITYGFYESEVNFRPVYIDLSDIKGVWICPGTDCMPRDCIGLNATGCSNYDIIYITGAIHKGKILINEAVMGHEVTHLLNLRNPIVANPDKFDDLFQ